MIALTIISVLGVISLCYATYGLIITSVKYRKLKSRFFFNGYDIGFDYDKSDSFCETGFRTTIFYVNMDESYKKEWSKKKHKKFRDKYLEFIENIHDNGTAYCVMFSLMC